MKSTIRSTPELEAWLLDLKATDAATFYWVSRQLGLNASLTGRAHRWLEVHQNLLGFEYYYDLLKIKDWSLSQCVRSMREAHVAVAAHVAQPTPEAATPPSQPINPTDNPYRPRPPAPPVVAEELEWADHDSLAFKILVYIYAGLYYSLRAVWRGLQWLTPYRVIVALGLLFIYVYVLTYSNQGHPACSTTKPPATPCSPLPSSPR